MRKQEINLLPMWVIQKKAQHTWWITVIAIEAVIFLLIILTVLLVDFSTGTVQARAEAWEITLRDARYKEAELVSDQLQALTARLAARRAWTADLPSARFDIRRLNTVYEACPAGVQIIRVRADETQMTVTAQTKDRGLIEQHRAQIASGGLFAQALLAAIRRIDADAVEYTLTLLYE